jgi:hypothetical protein
MKLSIIAVQCSTHQCNNTQLGEIQLKKTSHNSEKVTHCVVMLSAVVLRVVAPCLVLAYALTQ